MQIQHRAIRVALEGVSTMPVPRVSQDTLRRRSLSAADITRAIREQEAKHAAESAAIQTAVANAAATVPGQADTTPTKGAEPATARKEQTR